MIEHFEAMKELVYLINNHDCMYISRKISFSNNNTDAVFGKNCLAAQKFDVFLKIY